MVADPRQPVREVERCRPVAQGRAEISALRWTFTRYSCVPHELAGRHCYAQS